MGFTVGELTLKRLLNSALEATVGYGALSFILIGAAILAQSLTILGLPRDIVEFARGFQMTKYEVLLFVVLFYLVMGIFFDGISLMLTTVPFIYPVMKAVGFDPVWIGVFVTIMIEIGMLTPPIGVNLFVILAIARNKVSLNELSLECLPYWIMLLVGTLVMTLVPDVALLLPRLAY
jgi:C4-dicarboxylate transporter DctM subunit